MLSIRLTRIGKKKQPEYRFVIMEKGRDPWGKALEILGNFNPRSNPPLFNVKQDRIAYWIKNGAQCTDTVWNLFVDKGLVTGEKRKKVSISKKRKEKLAKKQAA